MQLVYLTDKGNIRNTNQDSYCIQIAQRSRGILALLCLCDGMGGLEQGEVASGAAVIAVRKWFQAHVESFTASLPAKEELFAIMGDCIEEIHGNLRTYSEHTGTRLGTTLSMMLLCEGHYYSAQVGDSRIYLSTSESIVQITRDQTLGQRLFEEGRLTPEELQRDSRRSVLEQCVGQRTAVPVFRDGTLEQEGTVILCSDGFYHYVTAEQLQKLLDGAKDRTTLKNALENQIRENRSAGETDNITVIAYRWEKDDEMQESSELTMLADAVGIHTE